jgi:uncharacterized protein (TIGR02284 family)
MDNKDIIRTLNRLIETSKDGEQGFQTTAEHVKSPALRRLFTARANECRQAAAELRALVTEQGGDPDESGSASEAVHRGWAAIKSALTGYTDLALLEECERGEDTALARYRAALEEDLPAVVRAPVERQYEGVIRNHAQVRALRDQARAATV